MKLHLKIILVLCPGCQQWIETRNESRVPRHGTCPMHGVKPAGVVK